MQTYQAMLREWPPDRIQRSSRHPFQLFDPQRMLLIQPRRRLTSTRTSAFYRLVPLRKPCRIFLHRSLLLWRGRHGPEFDAPIAKVFCEEFVIAIVVVL